ncbi:MAG: TonB-dependent receptor, partial [Acidobacteriota bacterium]|nr:TonB-dependent receptor [Acidobacteriota bacterium]
MKIIKILSLICLLWVGAFAQQGAIIQGKVSIGDEKNIFAKVSLSNAKIFLETTTNQIGFFKFENVPNGKYNIRVSTSQIIFTNSEIKAESGKTIFVEINSTGGVDAVTTFGVSEEVNVEIGTGTSQPFSEVSKTVNIIEAQELRSRADFALVETLRTIPGFRVAQSGGFGRTANIKTRGLRNQDTAILIDGIRFRDASSITGDASAFLSDFTLTSVSKIEVLRGSGSSLYGTNAIGGTVDFQTPKPQSGLHGQIGGAFGGLGLGRFRGNLSSGTQDGKFGFNLGASRTVYTSGIDGEDDAHNTNFQSRIEYSPFAKTNISARFFVSDADVRLNSSPDTIGVLPVSNAAIINAVPLSRYLLQRYERGEIITNFGSANFIPDANDADNFQASEFFNGQAALTQIINNHLVFNATYQGLKTSRSNTNGVLGVGFQPFGGTETSVFEGQIHTVNTHFNWTPNSNNLITAGYEYEWEKFGNDGLAADISNNFSTRAKQTSNTFYVQDLLSFFNNRLQIAGGFRVQFFNLKSPIFSANNPPYSNLTLENPPNAYTFDGSASYFFEQTGTKIRAHVGNGYRVPSLFERFGTFYSSFSQEFIALGDPNLRPE